MQEELQLWTVPDLLARAADSRSAPRGDMVVRAPDCPPLAESQPSTWPMRGPPFQLGMPGPNVHMTAMQIS